MDDFTDASPTEPSDSGDDRLVAGRYRIRRRLGRGSSKEVYLAYDERLDRDVALAVVVAAGRDDEAAARARFTREAQATGRLGDHPNVITVYDTGEHDGVPYLVLRAMEGGSLADAIRRRRPTIDEAARLGLQIAAGLAHAHDHGVVHRDVKPDNVWLDADGSAALGDFGVATRRGAERITGEGIVVGTVRYLSPEQIRGEEPTAHSDLYALGVTLYELVTGQVPFAASDPQQVLSQHLMAEPVPPSDRAPDLPPAFERLILELLAKDPADRPASAATVERELGRLVAPDRDERVRDPRHVVCPFKGLAPFEGTDAAYFCGRDRLVAQLVARLVGAPLLGVLGPSGSGKSSVMRAGLLPALANGALPGSEHAGQVLMRPGRHPLAELRRALGADHDRPLILAVDQFEETFISCEDEEERRAFIAALVDATGDGDRGCSVVLALRADFYGRCAAYEELASLLTANHVLVGPPRRQELREAIEVPARRAGLAVDSELTEALLDDVDGEPGALPLLSTALLELWQHRDGRRLTYAAYDRVGGARGAVSRLAEDAFVRLDEAQQRMARSIVMRLVTEGADGRVERRRVTRGELATLHADAGRVVEQLTSSRLLAVDEGTVELAHEALLHAWPRLQGWIAEDRDGLRIQRSLGVAASEWLRLQRDEGAVYRGGRLDEALRWQASSSATLNELERDFLAASDGIRRREVASLRRRRVLAASSAVAVVAAIAVLVAALVSSSRMSQAQRDAAESRELTDKAASLLESDPGGSLRVALQADGRFSNEPSRRAVRQGTLSQRARAMLERRGSKGSMSAVTTSRDGRRVAAAGGDGVVGVWDLPRHKLLWTTPGRGGVSPAAALSPDGRKLATATDDGHIRMANVGGGDPEVLSMPRLGDAAYEGANSLQFSVDGTKLVVGGRDDTTHVVDLAHGGTPATLGPYGELARGTAAKHPERRHEPVIGQEVLGAQLDRAGQRVVGVESTGVTWIRTVRSGESVQLDDGTPGASDATFRPDGRRVATAGNDGKVRVWDASSGALIGRPIEVVEDRLQSVRYSDDGRRLVIGAADGRVRVFDAASGILLDDLKGHRGEVYSVAFAAGGAAVSGGQDGTLRSWAPAATNVLVADAAVAPSFAADGRSVLWTSSDGGLHRWHPATGAGRAIGSGAACPGCVMRASRDGTAVVTASPEGEVRLYEGAREASRRLPATTERLALALDARGTHVAVGGVRPAIVRADGSGGTVYLRDQPGAVNALAFSPLGGHVATASDDGAVRIFGTARGAFEQRLSDGATSLTSLAYSADGRRIVAAAADGSIKVWPAGGGRVLVLRGHTGAVSSAVFDRDGDRIVSAGRDGMILIWDARTGEQLVALESYTSARSAAFSPDGERVLSLGQVGGRVAQVMKVSACEVCGSFADVERVAKTRTSP